ncbi:hypothetical protein ACYSNU_09510 [Enterococcus sp. LJL120]
MIASTKERIAITTNFLSSLLILLITIITNQIAIGLALALFGRPILKKISAALHQYRINSLQNRNQ